MADPESSGCASEGAEVQSLDENQSVIAPAQENRRTSTISDGDDNIILNPNFEDGLTNWSGRGCKILLHDSMGDGKVLPLTGKSFVSATQRTQNWNGIQQDITGRVQRKLAYEVTAVVRLFGTTTPSNVRATLWVQAPSGREQYIGIASLQASDKDWVQLQGKFLVNGVISKAVIFVEGPPPNADLLLNSLVVKHAQKNPSPSPPDTKNVLYGVNVVVNSDLSNGLNGWFPLGPCTLNAVPNGSPRELPPMASDSLGAHGPLNGSYILATNRSQSWMGPAQTITDKLTLHVTYQVSAWVRVSSTANGPQNLNVALGVDSQWVNGGQVEAKDERWYEIGGAFRLEKQPSRVIVYVQGPSAGVDVMLAALHIFPVDRTARFRHLKRQTDKVRKRDVVIKISGSNDGPLGTFVKVRQVKNSFPFGSCLMRTNMDNEDFVDFFTKNFSWGVFGNELKWYWTEAQQGNLNYTDADELLDLCKKNCMEARGHCIFWEVDGAVQSWIKSLNANDLKTAVQNRITSLLTRYKGKFKHYDVNNEMLHGSFYQDRLGKDIRAYMFKTAHQLDPDATLFVNDYHVEDASDTRATPEKYIEHIVGLQEQGAPVGGIGIQGHIDYPVGSIVCAALDKLEVLGLPIWFTELDVAAENEFVRAEDLEVMLREAYAHPAVEGVMLWGFWELYVRTNGHLVNAEGDLNEAGNKYLALRREWRSHARGYVDEKGEFKFRGFHGDYVVEVVGLTTKSSVAFTVEKGDSELVVNINL